MKKLFAIVNGSLIPADEASLYISDLAILRGYGIFDFFKTLNGKPVFLDDHLDRFYRSAAQMRLDVAFDRPALKALLQRLMDKNEMDDSGIRITLTGGYTSDGYTLATPNIIITQQPLLQYGAGNGEGLRLMTYEHQRQMPQVKTIDYLMAVWLQPLIKEQQADDVLYHYNNNVSECPRSNFFIVTKDDTIVTSVDNCLKGIIRNQVVNRCAVHFNIEERDISLQDLSEAREAFVTSSTKNVFPVLAIDGKPVGNGEPGIITTGLAGHIAAFIREEIAT